MSENGKRPHAELSGCAMTAAHREFCERMVGNTKLATKGRGGECVMGVQEEYVDGGSLNVTMQN